MAKNLTKKQRVLLQHVVNGDPAVIAAKKAYDVSSNQNASTIAYKTLRKQKFIELMDKLGITDQRIVSKLKDGLDAKKPVVTKDGITMVDDNLAQLGYVKTIMRTKGYTSDDVEGDTNGEPLIIRAVQFTGPTQINVATDHEDD